MSVNSPSASGLRASELRFWRRARLSRVRVKLGDGAQTTLHIASYDRATVAVRVVVLERPAPLVRWCEANHIRHAVVGGFYVRPTGEPLGHVQIQGEVRPSVAFDQPWCGVRACVFVDAGEVRVARRDPVEPDPPGDILQAGPLLVSGGRSVLADGADPEGFSAGAHQFDSDITLGRHPRAALALTEHRLLAVACDGRTRRDAGMELSELADTLIRLGARDALNLDGGGSASLVHAGRLRNRPREGSTASTYWTAGRS